MQLALADPAGPVLLLKADDELLKAADGEGAGRKLLGHPPQAHFQFGRETADLPLVPFAARRPHEGQAEVVALGDHLEQSAGPFHGFGVRQRFALPLFFLPFLSVQKQQ